MKGKAMSSESRQQQQAIEKDHYNNADIIIWYRIVMLKDVKDLPKVC